MSRKDGMSVSTKMTTGEIFQVVSVSRLVCLFRTVSILLVTKISMAVFTPLYSLFLPLPGSGVSEPLCERIVVYLQLRNLQRRQVV